MRKYESSRVSDSVRYADELAPTDDEMISKIISHLQKLIHWL